ncbi:MAG: peptide ABC transporter substrate-binding protein [Chloroflexi bacterium]|nr:peptide ABC transporter substrate-binding protein [Chloroflexota bacterium]
MKFWVWISLLFATVLVGCGSAVNSPSTADATAVPPTVEPTPIVLPTPPKIPVSIATPDASHEHIVLDVGHVGYVNSFDPQRDSNSNELDLIANLFVGLTRYNHLTNQIEPLLAESWQVSEDGLVWTFYLRQDVLWVKPIPSRTVPLTSAVPTLREVQTVRQVVAYDVVTAVQRACDPTIPTPDVSILYVITGCEAVNRRTGATLADLQTIGATALDPFTLQITLNQPASHFLAMTTLPLLRPVAREVIEAAEIGQDWAGPTTAEFQSNGPYVLSPQTDIGEEAEDPKLVLERNPFWPFGFPQGSPDTVNIWQYENNQLAYAQWQNLALDVTRIPLADQEVLRRQNNLKLVLVPEQAVFYLAYNFESPIFSNPNLRRAFSAAIDREVLVEKVYEQQGVPMRHFSPPGVWGAPATSEVGLGFDPDYARLQLAEAGVRSCRFLPTIRYMTSNSDTSLFQAETIRDMWVEELDCAKEQIVIEQVQFGALLANTQVDAGARRPDVWELGWASYYPDAHNWLYDVLHCSSGDNRMKRPCNEVDDLLTRAITAAPEQRLQIYRRAEDTFFGRDGLTPLTPLLARGRYLVRQTWITFPINTFDGAQYDTYFVDWELKKIELQQ